MRKALVFSVTLHLAVMVLAYFGVPMAQKELIVGSESVAIEVVAVAETTNLPPPRPTAQPNKATTAEPVDSKPKVNLKPQVSAKPQPPDPPKPQPQPQPETKKAEPPPKADPPVQANKVPAPEAEPQQVAQAKPQPASETKPQQAAKAEAQPARPAPPAPAPLPEPKAEAPELKPTPPPKPAQREKVADQPASATSAQSEPASAPPASVPTDAKPAPATDFASVLKTVDTLARNEPQKPVTQEAAPKKAETEVEPPEADTKKDDAPSSEKAFQSLIEQALGPSGATASASASGRTHDPSQPMSVSEIDEVRRQIERCWNIPAGARDAGDHVVTIRVEMSPDATPRSAIVLNEASTHGNPFHRAAAESALRAVLNPRCHPFRLPIEKYERWKTMTLVFNPKDMLGT